MDNVTGGNKQMRSTVRGVCVCVTMNHWYGEEMFQFHKMYACDHFITKKNQIRIVKHIQWNTTRRVYRRDDADEWFFLAVDDHGKFLLPSSCTIKETLFGRKCTVGSGFVFLCLSMVLCCEHVQYCSLPHEREM